MMWCTNVWVFNILTKKTLEKVWYLNNQDSYSLADWMAGFPVSRNLGTMMRSRVVNHANKPAVGSRHLCRWVIKVETCSQSVSLMKPYDLSRIQDNLQVTWSRQNPGLCLGHMTWKKLEVEVKAASQSAVKVINWQQDHGHSMSDSKYTSQDQLKQSLWE